MKFNLLILALTFMVISNSFQFEFQFQFTRFQAKRHQKNWPSSIKEKLYNGLFTVQTQESNSVPCSKDDKDCRNWFSVKTEAMKVVSDKFWPTDKTQSLYYVLTQKKTGAKAEYGQFLFAQLASDVKNAQQSKLKLASVCIPVNKLEKSFILTKCALDSCAEHLSEKNREKKCTRVYDENDHKIETYAFDPSEKEAVQTKVTNTSSQQKPLAVAAAQLQQNTQALQPVPPTQQPALQTAAVTNQPVAQAVQSSFRFAQNSRKLRSHKKVAASKSSLLKMRHQKASLHKLLVKKLKLSTKTFLKKKQRLSKKHCKNCKKSNKK